MSAVEKAAQVLTEHDDPAGWMWSDSDQMIYACQCGDHYTAGPIEMVQEADVAAASEWHRAHLAQALADAGLLVDEAELERTVVYRRRWVDGTEVAPRVEYDSAQPAATPSEDVEALTADEYERLLDGARRIEGGQGRETAGASMDCDYGHDLIQEVLSALVHRARVYERQKVAATLKRDHDMPPNKDRWRYDYRMGWWDAVHHAAEVLRRGIAEGGDGR